MSIYRLALIIINPANEDEFLLIKQTPPPKFGIEEYDSYVDSDLFDLPSTQLSLLQGQSEFQLDGAELCSDKLDLRKFDLVLALNQLSEQLGFGTLVEVPWRFCKYVEEPEFGPGPSDHTVFISGCFAPDEGSNEEMKQGCSRIGPLMVNSILYDSGLPKWDVPQNMHYQEYPLGVRLVPMGSRTAKPFSTTNLIVIAPDIVANSQNSGSFVANGDALIVDPGCSSRFHKELKHIVSALPRKLLVFITHHHPDHVDGLSVIQRLNPDAILLAHENTMRRVRKDDWSLGYTSIVGGEEIYVGGQQFRLIFAPGHTDGHMALFHINTHSLVVGDHCVGYGSALLDIHSGGNMADYFQTTYNFLDLAPRALIPMHGRVNLWPKHMLCQYLKNRRDRESSVLKAIENGGTTLFDIVSTVYEKVDRRLWIPASFNVRLHVEHLAQQHKLPEGFSFPKFQETCRVHFAVKWIYAYSRYWISTKFTKIRTLKIIMPILIACFATVYCVIKLPNASR
ncbi:hypothetical protein RND81_07G040300 [Saponaria officinalis]|uniref:Metallo-beta-lactamase domain-containing protein n=1 Tax=Saponaria officinalis TaxID=3572 RepID=A0AAW1JM57_SAPOF